MLGRQTVLSKIHLPEVESQLDKWEKSLRQYRLTRGRLREELDQFLSIIPEPQKTFARLRYVEGRTMEYTAEKMNYCPRSLYFFRRKILQWWAIYKLGGEIFPNGQADDR